jgi:hypothetical protein
MHSVDEYDYKFYNSEEDVKPEFSPVKCWSLLQFYQLSGRKEKIEKDSLEPIPGLNYLLRADKLYLKEFRGYDIDTLVFYYDRKGGVITEVENLRRYVADGRVTILFTPDQVEETKKMLQRVYKGNLSGEGTLDYRIFIKILYEKTRYDDFKTYGKSLTGTKTVCKMFEDRIAELWKLAYEKNNLPLQK